MYSIEISASKPHATNGTVHFTCRSGSNLSAPRRHGSEDFSSTKRGLLRALIQGLQEIEGPRSEGRRDVNVIVENVGFARELCDRVTAGNPGDPDFQLWSELIHLRTKFNLSFPQSGQATLRSAA